MVKKIIKIVFLILLTSCVTQYYVKKDENGEPIIDKREYSLNQKMYSHVFQVIDTTSLYVEIPSNEMYRNNDDNFTILIFHNDGYFESTSKKYFRQFKRNKNSIYYGGKFFVDEDKIFIEAFYPSKEGKTNYYIKEISEGKINQDTISITFFDNKHKYIKRSYNDVF